jgi:hypothetical protein
MLIGTDATERKTISRFVEVAFATRNKLVHGSEATESIKIRGAEYSMQDFVSQLEEYLRTSIRKLL